MPVGATIAASTAAAAISANAQKKNAKGIVASSDRAADLQNDQFNRVLDLNMPGFRVQQGALGLYGAALGLPAADLMRGGSGSGTAATMPPLEGAITDPRRIATGVISGAVATGPDGKYYDRAYLDDYQQRATQAEATSANSNVDLGFLRNINIPEFVKNQPGYATQRAEGMRGIQGSAAARGTLRSGRTLAALEQYGQRTFGDYYDKWLSRVGGLATGTGAKDQIASAGQTAATNIGNLGLTSANAQGQGAISSANAWAQGLGGASGALAAVPWGGNPKVAPLNSGVWT